MSEKSSQDKSHEATAKKLEDARRKGDIPRAQDAAVAVSYLALLVTLAVLSAGHAQSYLMHLAFVFVASAAGMEAEAASLTMWSWGALSAALPILLIPMIGVLGFYIASRSVVFAPDKLMPKLNRIDPITQAKQKFGLDGMVEFLKTAIKMLTISIVLVVILLVEIDAVIGSARETAGQLMGNIGRLLMQILIATTVIAGIIGTLDYVWQIQSHRRKLRMSHQELRDEAKESDVDPHLKAQRRMRGQAIATNRMLADVPSADVILVNPTHYAVALRWDRKAGGAPECVAKGVDEVAARIREAAAEAGVPIRYDPPTARALHATVKVGQRVPPKLYRAVAAAIRFADDMREKAKLR